MTYFRTIISGILLLSLLVVLSIPMGSIPPLGSFISPFSGFWQNADPVTHGEDLIKVEGISEEVAILYDDRHVPHIFASNKADLLYAQGYAIAKERLWQMDITTRSIEGKSAEVLGESALNRDKGARRKGLARAAQIAVESWSKNPEGYAMLESFSDGINAYISSLKPSEYPLEFKLLNYDPQMWSPYRTALFIKAMAVTLNSGYNDIPTSNALKHFGQDLFEDLYPDKNPKQSPIIQKEKWPAPSISFQNDLEPILEKFYNGDRRSAKESFIGSNNFAVSGAKSASGNVILANDPHLKLTLPSIWIEMHLVCPDFNTYGVSLPGMPGVTLGFNENISWGQTNVGQDVYDIYEVQWRDSTYGQYLLDDEWIDTEIVIENFTVKDSESVTDTVFYTVWGPVLKEKEQQTNLAQRWVSLDAPSPHEIDVYLAINQAKNIDEFKEALRHFSTPAQNFIFGSTSGDIGMFVTGKFPVKEDQQGRFVQDGSKSAAAWKGFIPFNELPSERNPSRNFVASANQHSADDAYPYYYNGGFEDFRGRYINRTLEQMEKVTPQKLMNLQLDAYSLKAEEALPLMLERLEMKTLTKKEKEVVESLSKWNFVYTSQSKAASYFELWWSKFYEMSFDEISRIRASMDIPYIEEFRLIEMMEEEHPIFDIESTDESETLVTIINQSFSQVGFDTLEVPVWYKKRNTVINHLTNIPEFGYHEINSPGHGNTPNAISRYNGPSWRMVVEMSDPIQAYGVYPGGISGNPGSPYYQNFVEDWDNGQYYQLEHSSDQTKIKANYKLILKPKE